MPSRARRETSGVAVNLSGMADTEGATFTNEDWYGEELVERRYLRCRFEAVDLTEAESRGAVFEDCRFGNVRFNASRHTDSAFLRCAFVRCKLFEAEFTGCKFTGSEFKDSALRPLTVTGGDWSFVNLAKADLHGVTVRDVRMREVDLSGANCDGATLAGVDLSGANLRGTRLTRCDLRGSDLTALDPASAEVRGARIDQEQAIVIAQSLGFTLG